jgi:UDP-N-acetylmuramoyl-tripeptide--D-alanyl-D-alanine ligase
MSALWTAAEAAKATGGTTTRDWTATGVSIDTRTLEPGDLFVALKDVRDGHDFVAAALEKGAAAALVSRVPDGVEPDAPLLIVPDVLAALGALGRAARARTGAKVVGITGSAGKTSTKKMLADALAGQGRVHAAEKSYNNHWGVPLTLARMPAETDFAVVEIGMNAPGEIDPLTRMTRPHAAIVTLVAAAHLEAFGKIEGIAHEKASIFVGLEPGGTAILNGDLPTTPILRDWAARHAGREVVFGAGEGAEWRLFSARVDDSGTDVAVDGPAGRLSFRLGTPGRHFAMNATAVLAAVAAIGADPALAARNLEGWAPPGGRGVTQEVALPGGGTATLIDDAFNANPASLAAALDVLAAAQPAPGGRRVAVLGDMLELGTDEARLHAEVADHPAMAAISTVHCVGPRMRHLWEALPEGRRGRHAPSAEDLRAGIADLARPGDVILVKGSKGSKVSLVVDAFRDAAATHRSAAPGTD